MGKPMPAQLGQEMQRLRLSARQHKLSVRQGSFYQEKYFPS